METKIRAAILFGGKSAEHEISLISAMNIIKALDRDKYEPILIGISKTGVWYLQEESVFMALDPDPKTIALTNTSRPIGLIPGEKSPHLLDLNRNVPLPEPDVAFPILHGPYGEDGTMQGLLRHLDWAFVGPDVIGSAVAMDKDVAKRLMSQAGIPNAPFLIYRKHERNSIRFDEVCKSLKLPLFVKPANLGSSVGISKVTDAAEFERALDLAFRFDLKIVVEQGLLGREIECAVLGNDDPKGSAIGEIVPQDGFYDYQSKYIDEKGAALLLPAPDLDAETVKRVQELAVRTYQVLECRGLARVDFFLSSDGELFVNEVNTLPGFTKISMYPSLWGISGIDYPTLIDQLLQLAISHKKDERALSSTM
jgi:D-alanine-D-alanine ligase